MFYTIENGCLANLDTTKQVNNDDQQYLGIICYDEIFSSADAIGLKNTNQVFNNKLLRFESHIGYDLMCVHIHDKNDYFKEPAIVHIYLKSNLLLFIGDDTQVVSDIIETLISEGYSNLNYSRVFALFLDILTEYDYELLKSIKNENEEIKITADKLFGFKALKQISDFKVKLLFLKKYFSEQKDVYMNIQKNTNDIFDKTSLNIISNLLGRSDRMGKNIDYIVDSLIIKRRNIFNKIKFCKLGIAVSLAVFQIAILLVLLLKF